MIFFKIIVKLKAEGIGWNGEKLLKEELGKKTLGNYRIT
jgi:hypothetical protein